MTIASTTALKDTVRTRLLDFTPSGGGSTLATQLTSRLFKDTAPDDVAHPYAVLRLIDMNPNGDDGRFLRDWLAEVVVYDQWRESHPSSPEEVVELAADTIEQAWLRWTSSDALVRSTGSVGRAPIDYANAPDPIDRSVRAIRLTLPFRGTTSFLAPYASG